MTAKESLIRELEGGGGGSSEPTEPPLDPPLDAVRNYLPRAKALGNQPRRLPHVTFAPFSLVPAAFAGGVWTRAFPVRSQAAAQFPLLRSGTWDRGYRGVLMFFSHA